MFQQLRSNSVLWFLLRAGLLLTTWYCIYEFWLNKAGFLDQPMINNLVWSSSALLRLLGYQVIEQTFEGMRTMGIDGTNGVWIGDPCNGLSVFAVFIIILACLPGSWKTKLWYIPVCLLIIHAVNIIRIAILAIIEFHSPASLDFNHTYTFQIFVYGIIFLMWMRWISRYSGIRTRNTPAA
jgi:exosortase family protein XrtF